MFHVRVLEGKKEGGGDVKHVYFFTWPNVKMSNVKCQLNVM